MDLQAIMSTKRFGAPTWVWVAGGTAVVAFIIFKMKQSKTAGNNANGANAQGQNVSAMGTGTWSSQRTDTQGNMTSSSFTGPAYSPGFLTSQAAYPMPYSGGDVYVNLPANTNQPNQPSSPVNPVVAYPPANPPPAATGKVGSYWYTLPKTQELPELTRDVYGLWGDSPAQTASERNAIDAVRIELLNPQIDWTQPVPQGTPIYVPLGYGGPANQGKQQVLPANATQQAPSSYQPPAQQASLSLIPSIEPMGTVRSGVQG